MFNLRFLVVFKWAIERNELGNRADGHEHAGLDDDIVGSQTAGATCYTIMLNVPPPAPLRIVQRCADSTTTGFHGEVVNENPASRAAGPYPRGWDDAHRGRPSIPRKYQMIDCVIDI